MTCLVCIYRRRSNNRKEDVVVRRDGPGAARWCSVLVFCKPADENFRQEEEEEPYLNL